MKKHLLIFGFAVLLLAGFNLRNNTVIATSTDFPLSEQVVLTQHDDSHRADVAREANSLFAPPSTRTAASGDDNDQNPRFREAETIVFTPQIQIEMLPEPASEEDFLRIAGNGAFNRAADYYVYTLRRIVI